MKIYLYRQSLDNEQTRLLIKYLRQAKIDFFADDIKKSSEFSSLADIDILLIYINKPDEHSSYLTALSLAEGKYVLYLTPANKPVNQAIQNLTDNKNFKNKLFIKSYTDNNLLEQVAGFLKTINVDNKPDLFNIKYTLRVSPSLNEYLNWQSEKLKTPKADLLRQHIKETLQADQEYQKFKNNQYKING